MPPADPAELTRAIIGAAIEVHRALGPGLLESVYEACLARELSIRALEMRRQVAVAVTYKGVTLDCGYRIDLIVESRVVVEIKATRHVLPIHEAQLLTYLRLSGCAVGLLLNFGARTMREGIRRYVL